MQSFVEAMQPYIRDGWKVLLEPKGPETDNNHLFAATYILLNSLLNQKDSVFNLLYGCALSACEIQPGLYRREPLNRSRIISHDEMIGIALISIYKAYNMTIYGKQNLWCYDNRVPNECTVRGWQGRFLSPISYYHARAGLKLTLWQKLRWSINAVLTSFKDAGDTSGRCLTFMMCHEMSKQRSWLISLAIKVFLSRCTKLYGTLDGLYSIYFGPNHPFSLYSKDIPFSQTF